jgi:hypothetical protein
MGSPIFDEWLSGNGGDLVVYTSTSLCEPLSTADQLGLHVNVMALGTATGFTLTLIHSQDGFRWFPKYRDQTAGAAIPQISIAGIAAGNNNFYWNEAWPAPPTMRFVQLELQYQGPSACHLKIFNTSRKRTSRQRSPKDECGKCRASGGFSPHMRVLHTLSPAEIATLRSAGARDGRSLRARLNELGPDTTARLDRALHMTALQVLAGKD